MKDSSVDTSGFQNIVLMLIGVLMVMLISNVVTIISNPDNIKIGALVTGSVYGEEEDTVVTPKFQNMRQDPVYIDVEANRFMVYQPPSQPFEVLARDLLLPGNEFEGFLDWIEARKTSRYVVLLLRPGSAKFQRRLRQIIKERGIDVGFEPWEAGRSIEIAGGGAPVIQRSSSAQEEDVTSAASPSDITVADDDFDAPGLPDDDFDAPVADPPAPQEGE